MPKILVFDIETSPITAYTWGLFDQNIGLNQIKEDWYLLSWAAKWLGEPASKVMYMDNSKAKNIRDDKKLVMGLAALLNEADIIITQNGNAFDVKKLNARAAINGLPPIKPCRSTDVLKEGRKVFKFTSHKLEYMTEKLNKTYKKLKHDDYPGFELWSAILKGDKKAWKSMKIYNIHDVLATEELYVRLQGWIKTQNRANYIEDTLLRCPWCAGTKLESRGTTGNATGVYKQYHCLTEKCGKWPRGKTNLLSPEKKKNTLRDGR